MPDKTELVVPEGTTAEEIIKKSNSKLLSTAVAISLEGVLQDLNSPVLQKGSFKLLTLEDTESLDILRHSCAHLMAMAIKELWPETLLAIGPTIDKGFYYDLDCEHNFTPEDFPKIEKKMKQLVKRNFRIERHEIPRTQAAAEWEKLGEIYKVELLKDITDEKVSYYTQGDFFDLCRGPHLPNVNKLKHFKILSCAGAYWRGNVNNKMLQRLYGTAFFSKEALEAHLKQIEEAKKRDHRRIGKDLDLFSFHLEGAGFPFWHPKGMLLYNNVMDYCRHEHLRAGYQEIKTPIILNEKLWRQSGHWDKYRENMYFTEIDETMHAVKPMNCPGGLLVYKSKPHSYREFPIKNFE
ncbi:MAG: threonine--tRNA ligase, partial [Fibrobacteria bacterium]|nr:threonine--tRNA ligase [Fibrobacteria bacterium]